jgi:hypothetical protein
MPSPLYPNTARAVAEQAKRAMRAANMAQGMANAAKSTGSGSRLSNALQAFTRGMHVGISAIQGSTVGQVAREVAHYSRNGTPAQRRMVHQFMASLGPLGDLLLAIGGGKPPSVQAASDLAAMFLKAMGREVSPEEERRMGRKPITAARRLLEATQEGEGGVEVPNLGPGDEEAPGRGDRLASNQPPPPRSASGGAGYGGGDPVDTGEMLPAPDSDNVYSYGYVKETASLYIRFRNKDTEGPGSLYRYSDVTPQEFRGLMQAGSKGSWVWDHLRIRGTVEGHQKDYMLVGIIGGYVPRKVTRATLVSTPTGWRMWTAADQAAGQRPDYTGAAWVPRNKLTTERNWVTSLRPLAPAFGGSTGPEGPGPNRGTPNRGGPNRGGPNRGSPRRS